MHWMGYGGGGKYEPLRQLIVEHYAKSGVRSHHLWLKSLKNSWVPIWSVARDSTVDRTVLERVAKQMGLEMELLSGQPRVSPRSAAKLRRHFASVFRGREAAAIRLGVSLTQFKQLRKPASSFQSMTGAPRFSVLEHSTNWFGRVLVGYRPMHRRVSTSVSSRSRA